MPGSDAVRGPPSWWRQGQAIQGSAMSVEIPVCSERGPQAMDMSPLDTVHCDSPGFNNFMLTLSPIMQLSSPQPTISPREGLHPMSPVVTPEEIPFAFTAPSLAHMVEGCTLAAEPPADAAAVPAVPSGGLASSSLSAAPSSASSSASSSSASSGGTPGPRPPAAPPAAGPRRPSHGPTRPTRSGAAGPQKEGGQAGRQRPPLNPSHHLFKGVSSATGRGSGSAAASGGIGATMLAAACNAGPVMPRKCNCRKSRCLKLYCECFAAALFCHKDCGCMDCYNTEVFTEIRNEAMTAIRNRNPHAFSQKIQYIEPVGDEPGQDGKSGGPAAAGGKAQTQPVAAHRVGCACRKSGCVKKYCECFLAGVRCGVACKCESCKNFTGSQVMARALEKANASNGAPSPAAASAAAAAASLPAAAVGRRDS